MRTLLVPGLALALAAWMLPAGASAQSWGDVPSWNRPAQPPPYYPPRPYYRPPAYRPPAYYPPYGYRPPAYGQYSAMCVTSRGTCNVGRRLRVGSPCGCFIPGFGQKRGAIQAY